MICPRCHGIGSYPLPHLTGQYQCFVCVGTGKVNILELFFYRLRCWFDSDFHDKT